MDKNSKDTVWWDTEEYHNDNHAMSEKVWKEVRKLADIIDKWEEIKR